MILNLAYHHQFLQLADASALLFPERLEGGGKDFAYVAHTSTPADELSSSSSVTVLSRRL